MICDKCGLHIKNKDEHWTPLHCSQARAREIERLRHENDVVRALLQKKTPQAAEWRDEGGSDDQC